MILPSVQTIFVALVTFGDTAYIIIPPNLKTLVIKTGIDRMGEGEGDAITLKLVNFWFSK